MQSQKSQKDELEEFFGVSLEELINESLKDKKVLTKGELIKIIKNNNQNELSNYNAIDPYFLSYPNLTSFVDEYSSLISITMLKVVNNLSLSLDKEEIENDLERTIYNLYSYVFDVSEKLDKIIKEKGEFSLTISKETSKRWAIFLNNCDVVCPKKNEDEMFVIYARHNDKIKGLINAVEKIERIKSEVALILRNYPGLVDVIRESFKLLSKTADVIERVTGKPIYSKEEKFIKGTNDSESPMETNHIIESLDDLFNQENKIGEKTYLGLFIEALRNQIVYKEDTETIELADNLSIERDLIFGEFLSLIYGNLDPSYLDKRVNNNNLTSKLVEKVGGIYKWKEGIDLSSLLEDGVYIKFNKKSDLKDRLIELYNNRHTATQAQAAAPVPVYNKLPASAGAGGAGGSIVSNILNVLEEIIKHTEGPFYKHADAVVELSRILGSPDYEERVKAYDEFKGIVDELKKDVGNLKNKLNPTSNDSDFASIENYKGILSCLGKIDEHMNKLRNLSNTWYESVAKGYNGFEKLYNEIPQIGDVPKLDINIDIQ